VALEAIGLQIGQEDRSHFNTSLIFTRSKALRQARLTMDKRRLSVLVIQPFGRFKQMIPMQ
jgi:hypothetical protein